jgi:hypothetical protein
MSEEIKPVKTRQNYEKSKLYPANTLNESIELLEKIKDLPLKLPVSYDTLAGRYGLKSANTKSLLYRISAAKQFGLITTSGSAVKLTEVGKKILFPQDASETRKLKKQCFQQPMLYQNLIKIYENKGLPSQIALENILLRDHGIAQSSKTVAAKVFLETIAELDLAPTGVLTLEEDDYYAISNGFSSENNNSEDVANESKDNSQFCEFDVAAPISKALPLEQNDYEQLVIPLGNKRKAIINMPSDAVADEAEYVKDMLAVMFKKLYGISL